MDGYSVKDAAIVLGIPERRVWELLARGVLAGAPEGPDGMIVFLQPRSSPASVAQPPGAAEASGETTEAKVNGNGGTGELSPFRELLTEFRNLTERYGQALLALGEARGEVASLRTRVEMLEARMDLRLPSSPPTSAVAWELPEFATEPAPPPTTADAPAFDEAHAFEADAAIAELDESVAGEDEPVAEPMIDLIEEAIFAEPLLEGDEEPVLGPLLDEAEVAAIEPSQAAAFEPAGDADEQPEPRRRDPGGRTAMAAFAAALARADDPTIAELPGAEETAAALAALQRDIDASRAAEPEAVPETEPQTAAAEMEPEAVPTAQMDGEPAELEPAELEPAELEPAAEPEMEPEPIAAADAAELPEAEAEPTAAVEEIESEPAAAPEVEVVAETQPAPPSVPSYYSTDVVEPDWFADGDFSWLEAAQAEAMRVEAAQAAVQEAEAEAVSEPASDVPGQVASTGEEEGEPGPVAADASQAETGTAAEVAFGERPTTEAAQPDLGHGGFEPSVESQAMAEEEARAAIQEAFEEAPPAEPQESVDTGPDALAAPVAEGQPEAAAAEADWPTEAAVEPEATQEPEAAQELEAAAEPEAAPELEAASEPEATQELEAALEPEYAAEGIETAPAEDASATSSADESVEGATDVTEAFPEESPEAEAIQEAFDEPMPAPEPAAPPADAAETGEAPSQPSAVADEAPSVDDARPADDAPRALDAAPGLIGAASATSDVRGPEEFIAPAPPPVVQAPATAPRPASGEEELMWLGDEFEAADLEVAAEGWRSPGAASSTSAGSPPTLELSDAELTQLAEDEGWDVDEVEAIRRLLGRQSDAAPEPAGAPEVASAPDDVITRRPSVPEPWSPDPSKAEHDEELSEEGPSGAAAEAYRRLRKLFPG